MEERRVESDPQENLVVCVLQDCFIQWSPAEWRRWWLERESDSVKEVFFLEPNLHDFNLAQTERST